MANQAIHQYVKVAVDVPLARTFDYLAEQATVADIGRRVMVSFGHRRQLGVIVDLVQTSTVPLGKLKPVDEILHDMPALSADLMALFQFCSQYYHYPLGQVIFTALPTRLRKIHTFQPKLLRYFQATHDFRGALPKGATVQHQLATALSVSVSEAVLKRISSQATKYLTRWLAEGWIKEVTKAEHSPAVLAQAPLLLNDEQHCAVQAITKARGFQPFLLYGVTGSGKTEVYLQVITEQLAQSRQILLLVPEINLTPQLEVRFKARFPEARIVSLHSNVSDHQRANIWLQAEQGEVDIVLGTRLAVFTPLPHLGLIIIDEEHDSSFKQQDGLRYHARDVAVFRAKKANVPVLLGSATPALESWHNAQRKRYQLLSLSQRAVEAAQLPQVHILSTEKSPLLDGLHPSVIKEIDQALLRQEQVLVFLNRRGYAPVLHCQQCGWLANCQRCSSRLVIHLREGLLKCHLCGHEQTLPRACPSCGDTDIKAVGQGTQRLEIALKMHFPQAEVIRIDRDSMRRKDSWVETFNHVKEGRGQILVGTQMLAKGHDFPHLGLAVMLNTDAGLYSADFRAEEKLFAQLMQVAGRVGRAHIPGQVLIQTQYPTHPLYLALKQYDYAPFATRLLQDRKTAHFPPYCFQAILRAEAHDLGEVMHFLSEARALAPVSDVVMYDPIPALLQKLAGKERAQLLLQDVSRQRLQAFIQQWLEILRTRKQSKVRWSLDIDPIEI
jgi:primosomal protein N' (replication factor Y)